MGPMQLRNTIGHDHEKGELTFALVPFSLPKTKTPLWGSYLSLNWLLAGNSHFRDNSILEVVVLFWNTVLGESFFPPPMSQSKATADLSPHYACWFSRKGHVCFTSLLMMDLMMDKCSLQAAENWHWACGRMPDCPPFLNSAVNLFCTPVLTWNWPILWYWPGNLSPRDFAPCPPLLGYGSWVHSMKTFETLPPWRLLQSRANLDYAGLNGMFPLVTARHMFCSNKCFPCNTGEPCNKQSYILQ